MNSKFVINQIVTFQGKKAKIIKCWWDGISTYKYEVRFIIGKNLAGMPWITNEENIDKRT